MLPFLKKKRPDGWLTVQCNGNRVELAHVLRRTGEKPLVRMLEVFGSEGDADSALARLRSEKHLGGHRCVSLLEAQDYRLTQTEAPSVPDEERAEAVRWRLKDMVDFSVADAAIAVVNLPTEQEGGRSPNVFAAAAPRSAVAALMARMAQAKLALEAIDIPEMAIRNVAALLETPNRGLGTLYIGHAGSLFVVTYRGELALSRRMDLSATQLLNADSDRRAQLIERLGLELQRTLDNFDRQFSFVSVSGLLYACVEDLPDVLEKLKDSVYFPIRALDLAEAMDFPAVPELRNPTWQAQCLLSLGAALRD